jgi:hypothetical protein
MHHFLIDPYGLCFTRRSGGFSPFFVCAVCRAGGAADYPVWAAWIEFSGKIGPLTPLENWLRMRGGGSGYAGGFVGHYLMPILYPSGLTRKVQFILGGAVIAVNLIIYGYIFFIRRLKGGKL